MTLIYVPRLIESAGQAEALPLGTVATSPIVAAVAIRVGYGLGWSVSGDEMSDMHAHLVGWSALVPIEAEEETRQTIIRDSKPTGEPPETRLVTPWEEA